MHVPKIMTQTRVRHEHVEQTVEVPIPHTQEPADAVGWFRGRLYRKPLILRTLHGGFPLSLPFRKFWA